MSQLGAIEPLAAVQEITEPLAIKDTGNIQRFNEAAERNLSDLRGLSLGINTDLVPKLNALVALLNQQLPYINTVSAADAEIRTNANNIASINTLATHIAALLAVNLRLTEVQAVADNMAGVLAAQGYAEEAHRWAVVAETVGNVGIATAEKVGLVKPGVGLEVDAVGVLRAKLANMLDLDTSGSISVKLSENFTVNSDGQIKINSDSLPPDTPIGSIIYWPGSDIPENWLPCNGDIVAQTAYPELYAEISNRYNVAATIPMGQFQLPNLEKQYSAAPSRQTAGNTGVNASRIHINPINGDVWAFTANGTSAGAVSVLRAATGTWEDSGLDPTGIWSSIAFNTTTGDIWVSRNAVASETAKISLVLKGGTGTWESAGLPADHWTGITVEPVSGDVWAIRSNYAYRLARGTGTWVSSGYISDDYYFRKIFVNNATHEIFAIIQNSTHFLYKYINSKWENLGLYLYGFKDALSCNVTGDILITHSHNALSYTETLAMFSNGKSIDIDTCGFRPYYIGINQLSGDIFISRDGAGIRVLRKDGQNWDVVSNDVSIGAICVNSITGDIFIVGSPVTVLRGGTGKPATPIIRASKAML